MSIESMKEQIHNHTPAEPVTAQQIALGLQDIYEGFTEAIRSMGSKKDGKKGKSPFAQSALHWLTGDRVKTERDIICDKFLQDVQKQLQTLDLALEGLPEAEVQEACGIAADILTEPVPEQSNHSSALMKRAMAGQVIPYLSRLSREKLEQLQQKIETAYKKNQRLPVEQEVMKEIRRLLK